MKNAVFIQYYMNLKLLNKLIWTLKKNELMKIFVLMSIM